MPFPKDLKWTGSKGRRAEILDGDLLLQGQPVRSQYVGNPDAQIKLEWSLEQRKTRDCSLTIYLSDHEENGSLAPKRYLSVRFKLEPHGRGKAIVSSCDGDEPKVHFTKDLMLQEGGRYTVGLHLRPEGMMLKLGEDEYQTKAKPPVRFFRIRLMNWEPDNIFRFHRSRPSYSGGSIK